MSALQFPAIDKTSIRVVARPAANRRIVVEITARVPGLQNPMFMEAVLDPQAAMALLTMPANDAWEALFSLGNRVARGQEPTGFVRWRRDDDADSVCAECTSEFVVGAHGICPVCSSRQVRPIAAKGGA